MTLNPITPLVSNPYDNNLPVDSPSALYGRNEVIADLIAKLLNAAKPQSRQIVGMTRMGKSSLLKVLPSLSDANYLQSFVSLLQLTDFVKYRLRNTLFVPIDFQMLGDNQVATFWHLLGESVLQSLHDQHRKRYDRFPLAQKPCTSVGEFKHYLIALDESKAKDYIGDRLFIVFLMDNFERVMQDSPIEILNNLRSLLGKYSALIAYMTASHKPLNVYHAERIKKEPREFSPLYNYFDPEVCYLGLLSEQGTQDFIIEPTQSQGITFSSDDIAFARSIGGRHPDLTRLTCKILFEQRCHQPTERLDYDDLMKYILSAFTPTLRDMLNSLSPEKFAVLLSLHKQPKNATNLSDLYNLNFIVDRDESPIVFSPILATFLAESGSAVTEQHVITLKNMQIWPNRRIVEINNDVQVLSPKEWQLFTYLQKHVGQTCTRKELLQGPFLRDSKASLDITISRLRQKVGADPERLPFIRTVRGAGWRLEV